MYEKALLDKLERALEWHRDDKYYANFLDVTIEEMPRLRKLVRIRKHDRKLENKKLEQRVGELQQKVIKYEENIAKGTGELIIDSTIEIKTLEELIEKCEIDTTTWDVERYVQNFWGNAEDPRWQVKAFLKKKPDERLFQDAFIGFLNSYQPAATRVVEPVEDGEKLLGCLIVNKQDAHLNRYDTLGKNDIQQRFDREYTKVNIIIKQARLSHNLDRLVYILGSDVFNSEWTGLTTKGTPQENILEYQESFERVCEHEIRMIRLMLESAYDVDVIFVPGNHDEYAGWHLVNWLKCYFRDEPRLIIEDEPNFRKYVSYGNTAMMFNHGDAIKNAKLAGIFPMEYKDKWSEHSFFYAFTGDVHIETSENINSIKFYRVAAFATSRSKWENKNGYIDAVGEATGFLIDETHGMTNIFKHYL